MMWLKGAFAFAALAFAASSAMAQGFTGAGYYGGGYGIGYAWNPLQFERMPYYSYYPPVYYSLPVPRTYGYSPFAYPPGTMTPEMQIEAPLEIQNPYVPQTPVPAKPASDRSTLHRATKSPTIATAAVENPYYVQSLSSR